MSGSPAVPVLAKLAALQAELVEQAYALERQRRLDAADVALAASLRLAEIRAELEAGERQPSLA
jgi:hypothetical protein